MVCRDKDANSGWTSASDGTLEERRYYCQNWRSDVVCITDSSGDPQEWIRYSAYGVPFSIPKGDYTCDGVLDSNDTAALTGMVAGSPGFWTDFNQDGVADSGDISSLTAYITANSSAPGGRGKLSRGDGTTSASSLGNRLGYAGYQFDPALAGSVWHVRNRVLLSELGRWTRRDPIGYVDGANLYQYAQSKSTKLVDAYGTASSLDCSNPAYCYNMYWNDMLNAATGLLACTFYDDWTTVITHIGCAAGCIGTVETGPGFAICMAACEGGVQLTGQLIDWYFGNPNCIQKMSSAQRAAAFRYAACRAARRARCRGDEREELIEPFDPTKIVPLPKPGWHPRTGGDPPPVIRTGIGGIVTF